MPNVGFADCPRRQSLPAISTCTPIVSFLADTGVSTAMHSPTLVWDLAIRNGHGFGAFRGRKDRPCLDGPRLGLSLLLGWARRRLRPPPT
jgi:hypothetical protein